MTTTSETSPTEQLLEQILNRIESIDKNVDEILDRVNDHLDTAHGASWYDDSYFRPNGYD